MHAHTHTHEGAAPHLLRLEHAITRVQQCILNTIQIIKAGHGGGGRQSF